MELKITGCKEIDRRLQELGKNSVKKIIRQALRNAAKPIADEARLNAPKATGEMATEIKVRAMKRSRKGYGIKIEMSMADTDKWYAPFIEYGWKAGEHKIEGKGFMRRAYDVMAPDAKEQAINEIKRAIEEKVKKLGGANA